MLRQNSDAIAYATFTLANANLPGDAASAAATAEAASRDRTGFNPFSDAVVALAGASLSRSGLRSDLDGEELGAIVSKTSFAPGR